jgi:hypothetical protein
LEFHDEIGLKTAPPVSTKLPPQLSRQRAPQTAAGRQIWRSKLMVSREDRLAQNLGETQPHRINANAGQNRLARGEHRAL